MLIDQQPTAIMSYREFIDSGRAVKQSEKVFKAFEVLKYASDFEVHKFTGIPIRSVGARRTELGDRIMKAGTRKDKYTETNVLVYEVNPFPSMFPVKKVTAQKKRKMILDLCKEYPGELADQIIKIISSK